MMYFDKEFAANSSGIHHKTQRRHVLDRWRSFNANEAGLVRQNSMQRPIANAAAIIPQDVYREFENQTKELMRANNLVLMNDLMPLAKSLPLGKVEHIYRQASDSGIVTTDLDGQTPAELDKADYNYDSTIKVFHKTGFGRSWMEMEGQRTEGFDALFDDQENAVRALQDKIADHIYNGVDVSFKGTTATGIKNSTKVQAVDLDATDLNINFATSTSPSAIRAGWIAMRDKLRIDNNMSGDLTFYISSEIESNLLQYYGTEAGDSGKTVMQTLMELPGVADIKMDRSLSGNEVVYGHLNSQFIRPLVGMAVTTVPLFRANPFDNYNFITWTNVGLEIKTDYAGRTGWAYAREIS
jgi:hypothetical protein